MESKRIPSLDGMRAVSILLVVTGHARNTIGDIAPPLSSILTVLGNAELGVSIFFVISGYLITTLLLNEEKQRGRISLSNFYLRRIFRILPPYYCYVGFILLLGFAGVVAVTPTDGIVAFLFLWNYCGQGNWWLGHSWSLSLEEQYYLVWPLSLQVLGRRSASWFAVGLIVAAPFIRVATYLLVPDWRGRIPIMLHTRIDCLMFGCCAALFSAAHTFQRQLKFLFAWRVHVAAAIFLFLLSPFITERYRGAYMLPIGFTLEAAAALLILLWVIQNPRSIVGKFLNSFPIVHLGVISYSLYLWQQLFLTERNTTVTGSFPLNIVCCLIAAECSYFSIEKGSLWLRRRLTRPARPILDPQA